MFLKKHLGQHLLVAGPTLEKIVRTLAPSKQDTVLEIGPGTGNLTKHLLKQAGRVVAVEKDAEMVSKLKSEILGSPNLEIIHGDFLKLDLAQELGESGNLFCGNLPYNISTPVMFKLSENRNLFSRGVVTIQREVAQRLVAKPGSKDYGILSILMQVSGRIEKCFDISPKSFFPPPKVTSSVIKIVFTDPPPYQIADYGLFSKIIKAVFRTRRKMIRNSLPEEYLHALEAAGIEGTVRPEELPIEAFILLLSKITA